MSETGKDLIWFLPKGPDLIFAKIRNSFITSFMNWVSLVFLTKSHTQARHKDVDSQTKLTFCFQFDDLKFFPSVAWMSLTRRIGEARTQIYSLFLYLTLFGFDQFCQWIVLQILTSYVQHPCYSGTFGSQLNPARRMISLLVWNIWLPLCSYLK